MRARGGGARTRARARARTQQLCTHARTHARRHARTHARTHAPTHARTHTRTHAPTHAHCQCRAGAHTHAGPEPWVPDCQCQWPGQRRAATASESGHCHWPALPPGAGPTGRLSRVLRLLSPGPGRDSADGPHHATQCQWQARGACQGLRMMGDRRPPGARQHGMVPRASLSLAVRQPGPHSVAPRPGQHPR
jgi:hypothetical protein